MNVMLTNNYLKVKAKLLQVLLPEADLREAKSVCKRFFGDRHFSQFVREAIERYVEYFKSHEEPLNTKRFYCDLDKKVYESLINYSEDKDAQVGEIASKLISEKLFELGEIEGRYRIPKMTNLVF